MKTVLVAPSTDPCPLENLVPYVKHLLACGADWIHCDVMDGVFVERKNFDHTDLMRMHKATKAYFDVHLMVQEPSKVIDNFVLAGASGITVHIEAMKSKLQTKKTLGSIRLANCRAGLALNPATPVDEVLPFLGGLDTVLVMSVVPGKSGQTFISSTLEKIAALAKYRSEHKLDFLIEVDGGLNVDNAPSVLAAGADVLVFGSAAFKATDKAGFFRKIKSSM